MSFLAVALAGCAKAPVDVLVDRSVAHLQAAVGLMQEAHGDDNKLLVGAMRYRMEHHKEFIEERAQGEALLRTLSDEDKRRIETSARNRTGPLMAQIEIESHKFAKPMRALRYIRPLIVIATPKPRTDGKLPWLPDLPELPPQLLDEAPATAPTAGAATGAKAP